jgi:hypothetical protein
VPVKPVSGLLNPGDDADEDDADEIDVVTGGEGDRGADLWSQEAEAATASKTPIAIAPF